MVFPTDRPKTTADKLPAKTGSVGQRQDAGKFPRNTTPR